MPSILSSANASVTAATTPTIQLPVELSGPNAIRAALPAIHQQIRRRERPCFGERERLAARRHHQIRGVGEEADSHDR